MIPILLGLGALVGGYLYYRLCGKTFLQRQRQCHASRP